MFSSFSTWKKLPVYPSLKILPPKFTILLSLLVQFQFNHSRRNLRLSSWITVISRTKRERERENCCERRLIYRCSRRSGRRSAEGWEARLFADVMVATASRSSGSPRGRGRFTNRGSPQPRDPLKNESGRVLRVFVTFPSRSSRSGPTSRAPLQLHHFDSSPSD